MGVYISTIREKYDSDKQKWVAVSESRMDNIHDCYMSDWLDRYCELTFPEDITDEAKEMLSGQTYGKGCLFFSQDIMDYLKEIIQEEKEEWNCETDTVTDAVMLLSFIKKMIDCGKNCRMIYCFS